jgi:hypothetical protein
LVSCFLKYPNGFQKIRVQVLILRLKQLQLMLLILGEII